VVKIENRNEISRELTVFAPMPEKKVKNYKKIVENAQKLPFLFENSKIPLKIHKTREFDAKFRKTGKRV
jgi:hypothetical protein